jgi:RHS repeat-associated protein
LIISGVISISAAGAPASTESRLGEYTSSIRVTQADSCPYSGYSFSYELGDLPVAPLSLLGQFYIAPDHLGAPHQVTDSTGAVAWQWNPDPFGNGAPVGNFSYEHRFPGQFFDQATKLHYNYFRDYDPRLGRYIESDPIGLAGGINTYAYAEGHPLIRTDPTGLLAGTLIDKRYDEVGGITHCTYSTPLGTYTLEIQGFCSCPATSPAPF